MLDRFLEPIEHLDSLLLLFLLCVVGCACGGLWLGVPISGFPFWGSFAAFVIGLLVRRKWKLAVGFAVAIGAVWLLTAYSFAYRGHDVACCHFPIAEALTCGWNPIRDRSLDSFASYFGGAENVKLMHAWYQPKFMHLAAATVMSATGLFSALPFAGWMMAVVLFCVARRFAVTEWNCSRVAAALFVLLTVAVSSHAGIQLHIRGCCDYLLYASGLTAAFSGFMWARTHGLRDLLIFSGSVLIVLLTRYNGIPIGLIMILILSVFSFRDRRWWFALAGIGICFVLMGASPYLLNQYPVLNLTDDFACNADGARMGWLSRIVYFWFSRDLVVCWFEFVHGLGSFAPEFFSGNSRPVNALGDSFRTLMTVGVLLSLLTKGWRIKVLCAVLFFGSMCLPLKYMGYDRYFPLVWPVPILLLFDFCYCHRWSFGRQDRRLRIGCLAVMAVVYLPYVWLCLNCMDFSVSAEIRIQNAFETLREQGVEVCRISKTKKTQKNYFTYVLRTEAAGFSVGKGKRHPKLQFASPRYFIPVLRRKGESLAEYAPDSIFQKKEDCSYKYSWNNLRYPWGFSGFPKILLRNGDVMRGRRNDQ